MTSPFFQRTGWPLSSGMLESASTLVGEARLTGSGLRREHTSVPPLRAVQHTVWNECWQEIWHTVCHQR